MIWNHVRNRMISSVWRTRVSDEILRVSLIIMIRHNNMLVIRSGIVTSRWHFHITITQYRLPDQYPCQKHATFMVSWTFTSITVAISSILGEVDSDTVYNTYRLRILGQVELGLFSLTIHASKGSIEARMNDHFSRSFGAPMKKILLEFFLFRVMSEGLISRIPSLILDALYLNLHISSRHCLVELTENFSVLSIAYI